jgi:GR25 family glycosyltransferase involved in LPS biosynthesis
MKSILTEQNVPGVRFPATNGKTLKKKDINKYFQSPNYNVLTGNIGTLLSHTNLWKKIQNEEHENILILEDDIIFVNDFNTKLEKIYKDVPENWDILYIGSNRLKGTEISPGILKPQQINLRGYNAGMYGYMIKKSSIDKLLNILFPLPITKNCIDVVLRCNFDKINAYFLTNKLINHFGDFKSERLEINKLIKL